MKLVVPSCLNNSSLNFSALLNILDLLISLSHIEFTISKYQEDIFDFLCSKFVFIYKIVLNYEEENAES